MKKRKKTLKQGSFLRGEDEQNLKEVREEIRKVRRELWESGADKD